MPVLFRWLFLGCLNRVALTLVALLAIFLIAESFDKARYLGHGLTTGLLLEYLLLKIPFMVADFMPVIVLLAASLFISDLARHHEIVALRAAGLGVNKVVLPLLAVAVLAAGLNFAIGEWVAPVTNQRLDVIENVHIHHRPDTRHGIQWLKDGHRFFRLEPLGRTDGVSRFHLIMLETDAAGHWKRRVDAARAVWKNGVWKMRNVHISVPAGEGIRLDHRQRMTLNAETGPDAIDPPSPRHMRLFELMRYARQLEDAGLASASYRFSAHRKLATPVLCLIMALLAASLCMHAGSRSGRLSWGVAAAITLGLGSYVVNSAVQIAAGASWLPPGFAAWLPDIVAAGFTGFLLLHQEGY